jgi:hypothetical protein
MTTDLDRPLDLLELIRGGELPEVEDPLEVKQMIVARILSAETEAEVFEAGGSTAANDLKDVAIELRDVKVMRSEIDGALPVYMLLDAVIEDTGRPIVLNTSAARLMAQAWRAKELGLLPKRVKVVEVAKPKPGQSAPIGLAVLEQERAGGGAERGAAAPRQLD